MMAPPRRFDLRTRNVRIICNGITIPSDQPERACSAPSDISALQKIGHFSFVATGPLAEQASATQPALNDFVVFRIPPD